MQVRRATVDDVIAMAEAMKLVVDEGGLLGTKPPVTVRELSDRFRFRIAQGHALWVLLGGEKVVGSLGLHSERAPGVLTLGMWIVDGHRGGGGGRMLVQAAMAHADSEPEVHKVDLEVYVENAPAIALYESAGFLVEGRRERHYRQPDGELRSTLLMARRADGA